MMEALPKRPFHAASISTAHRDVTDDRYRDLRRPRKVRFFCNGDRYFKGKRVHITPHRYLTFNDLLNDLTGKLPNNVQLPYGVRNIYTPVSGRRIRDIAELQDGQTYVCGGFETFKPIKYGTGSLEPWSVGKPQSHEIFSDTSQSQQLGVNGGSNAYGRGYYGAFQPTKPLKQPLGSQRRAGGTFGQRSGPTSYWGGVNDSSSHTKPKVITVVRNGEKPRANVKILLNRRSVQSFEQLVKDITEAFGSKWKGNRIRKLFTIKGREVQSVSDFFREDDVFVGLGNEQLTTSDVQDILEDLYPDSPYAKNLLKEWERTRKRYQASHKSREPKPQPPKVDDDDLASKFDSGFGSELSTRDENESDVVSLPVNRKKKKKLNKAEQQQPIQEEDLAMRLERERAKAADADRERARKRMQKRLDAERRALDEERRKRGLVPLRPLNDPFKRLQEEREKEEKNERRLIEEAKEEEERERHEERLAEEAEKAREKERQREKREKEKERAIQEKEKKELERRQEKERQREQELKRQKEEEKRKRREAEERARAKSRNTEPEEPKVIVVVKEEGHGDGSHSRASIPKSSKSGHHGEEKPDNHGDERSGHQSDEKLSPSRTSKAKGKVTPSSSPTRARPPDADDSAAGKDAVKSKSKSRSPSQDNKHKEKEDKDGGSKEKDLKSLQEGKLKADEEAVGVGLKDKDEASETEKKKKLKKQGIIRKTKLERQISNLEYVLDKYDIGKTLGDGNFALVKQSRLKNTNQDYAMKVIDKSKLKGKEHMIENEIEIMKRCSQQNIVKLHEEFETKDEIYLVMELVKGGDLFDAITQSVKFTEPVAAGMVADLANALFYLHSREIVHRDLKPENLLVCRNKDNSITLKLADFGLAMEVHELIYTVCGTPTYVAPEILSETGYGLEVDMWATGVITYILLCGFPPFRSPDRNQTELFEFIKAGEYEFLSPYWDKISRSAKDLISKLLVVDRLKRYTAIKTLCHPWTVTRGGSVLPPTNLDAYRQNLQRDLESQGRINLKNYKQGKYS